MPLKNYADARTLVIRSFGDLYNRDTLDSVTMIDLPTDTVTTHDEANDYIETEINSIVERSMTREENIRWNGCYTVDDIRRHRETGASGLIQEIIVSLTSDPVVNNIANNIANGIANGAANTATLIFMERILSWADRKRKKSDKSPRHITDTIAYSRAIIAQEFNPLGELEIESSSSNGSFSKVTMTDSQANIYEVKIQNISPFAISARRIRPPKA